MKFGLFFFDYDLDGRLDLLSAHGHLESDIAKVQATETYEQSAQLFWNTGRPGRALFALSTYADIDGDGDLDVVLAVNGAPARLFRNRRGHENHWVRLHLTGDPSNRSAIGAKVSLKAGGRLIRRQLFPAKGYLSSVELLLTFGLGRADRADEVTITWPSGKRDEMQSLAAGRLDRIDEARGLQ